MRVWQEFYCNDCDGYIRIKLNMSLNFEIEVVCPECGRKHPRVIKDGQIFEKGSRFAEYREEICPPKSAYHKEPWTKKMQKVSGYGGRRDGVVINKSDIPKDNGAQFFLDSLWQERHGGDV